LLILRGPSASGKSTIAQQLFSRAKDKTVLIQQDHYRFIFNPSGGGSKPNSEVIHSMIEHNALTALLAGYNVILEGILSVQSYQSIIERLIKQHSGRSFIFYFDIRFEETVKRHNCKKSTYDYGVDEMKEWYLSSYKSGHELEILLGESETEHDIIDKIIRISGFEINK